MGTDVYGTPYSSSKAWSIKFDNTKYDQFMFTSGDYTKWLVSNKDAVLGWYANNYRSILKSSTNSNPYVARWYRRTPNPEDPWISLGNYASDVIYGNNGSGGNLSIVNALGGAKVFIRDSTVNNDVICLGPNTVEHKTGCQWTPTSATLTTSSCECLQAEFILERLGDPKSLEQCN